MRKMARGMSVIEYSLVVAAVAIGLVGMSVYVKSAISGRWKQSMDVFGFGRQYESGKTTVSH